MAHVILVSAQVLGVLTFDFRLGLDNSLLGGMYGRGVCGDTVKEV